MKRNVMFVALAVAALSGFMLWNSYLRFYGLFENGRYVNPETGRVFVERAGLMWGSLFVISLVLAFVVSRQRRS